MMKSNNALGSLGAALGAFGMLFSYLHAAEPFVAPDFVKELEDLPEVVERANVENKGITFLLMEPGST